MREYPNEKIKRTEVSNLYLLFLHFIVAETTRTYEATKW